MCIEALGLQIIRQLWEKRMGSVLGGLLNLILGRLQDILKFKQPNRLRVSAKII